MLDQGELVLGKGEVMFDHLEDMHEYWVRERKSCVTPRPQPKLNCFKWQMYNLIEKLWCKTDINRTAFAPEAREMFCFRFH